MSGWAVDVDVVGWDELGLCDVRDAMFLTFLKLVMSEYTVLVWLLYICRSRTKQLSFLKRNTPTQQSNNGRSSAGTFVGMRW